MHMPPQQRYCRTAASISQPIVTLPVSFVRCNIAQPGDRPKFIGCTVLIPGSLVFAGNDNRSMSEPLRIWHCALIAALGTALFRRTRALIAVIVFM